MYLLVEGYRQKLRAAYHNANDELCIQMCTDLLAKKFSPPLTLELECHCMLAMVYVRLPSNQPDAKSRLQHAKEAHKILKDILRLYPRDAMTQALFEEAHNTLRLAQLDNKITMLSPLPGCAYNPWPEAMEYGIWTSLIDDLHLAKYAARRMQAEELQIPGMPGYRGPNLSLGWLSGRSGQGQTAYGAGHTGVLFSGLGRGLGSTEMDIDDGGNGHRHAGAGTPLHGGIPLPTFNNYNVNSNNHGGLHNSDTDSSSYGSPNSPSNPYASQNFNPSTYDYSNSNPNSYIFNPFRGAIPPPSSPALAATCGDGAAAASSSNDFATDRSRQSLPPPPSRVTKHRLRINPDVKKSTAALMAALREKLEMEKKKLETEVRETDEEREERELQEAIALSLMDVEAAAAGAEERDEDGDVVMR